MVKRRSTPVPSLSATFSTAERLRQHREEMALAMERRISLPEARALIEQRKSRAHWEHTNARLQAKMNGQPAPSQTQTPFVSSPRTPFVSSEVETPTPSQTSPDRPLPWWQRD